MLLYLKDRLPPETRIGLQWYLKAAGIPYYDPERILSIAMAIMYLIRNVFSWMVGSILLSRLKTGQEGSQKFYIKRWKK